MSSAAGYPPPPPSIASAPNLVAPYKAPVVLPLLAVTVFILGLAGSAVLAFCWPLVRVGQEMDLGFVVTEPAADGSVFNVPLFIMGAGPSILTAAVLCGAGSIITELRKARALTFAAGQGR